MRLRVDILGEEVFNRAFNRLDSLSDMRPLWPPVIEEFYRIEQEQFDSEGSAGGDRFTKLSDAYAKRKAREFPGQPILQATGDLMASLTDFEAADAILRPLADELTIGTSVPYAIYHQSRRPRKTLPRRPPISFSEAQKRRLQKAIQVGLVRFVRQAGFNVQENAA